MRSENLAPEAELIARSKKGDTGAFDQLITLHRERIYMLAYHIVRNAEDALDLSQEAFIRAWKSLGRFDGTASFGTWISKIATNASIDLIRRRQSRPQTEIDSAMGRIDPASRTTPKQGEEPGVSVDREVIRKRVEASLDTLSPEHRTVIVLKEVDGMSYKEIADTVGCTQGTVMSRLFYARKKLQSKLRDLYEEL